MRVPGITSTRQSGISVLQWGEGQAGPSHANWNEVSLQVVPSDSDSDGVPDDRDQCPGTAAGDVVDEHGCSIHQLVPCAGPATGGAWNTHGQYVAAVAKAAETFLAAGRVSQKQAETIVETAAQSDCGKKRLSHH